MRYIPLHILCAGALLTGCAAAPSVMTKPGGLPAELSAAQYDCQVQADQSSGAIAYRLDPLAHLYYLSQARDNMFRCLASKGWVKEAR